MYELFTNQIYETGKETSGNAPNSSVSETDEFFEALDFLTMEEDVFRKELLFFPDEPAGEFIL